MSVSRRGFLQGLGVGRTSHASAFIAARGHEELVAEAMQQQGRQGGGMRRPHSPAWSAKPFASAATKTRSVPARPRSTRSSASFPRPTAIRSTARRSTRTSRSSLAKLNTAKRENVVLGVGSQELLKNAARVFMSPTKHLVIPSPTYGDPAGLRAERPQVHRRSRRRSTEKTLKTDLAALLPHVKGAGLVYICNPNNPTVDDQQRAGDQGLHRRGEEDLADHRDPDRRGLLRLRHRPGFQTAIPVALATPGVLVARTFSKAYGMAGVRIGYAIGDAATDQEDVRLADAVQRQHVRRRRGGRVAQGSAAHQGRERPATRRCATSR